MVTSSATSGSNLVVFGLDCAEPSLVFDRFAPRLPTLRRLSDTGFAAGLRSTDPPVTIPAWTSMTTGKDPGYLGLYGIRNRVNYDYDSLRVSTSNDVHVPRVWDMLSEYGKSSVLVGIPQTWPVKPVKGVCIAGIPAPENNRLITWPETLAPDIFGRFPAYRVDIGHFRSMSPAELARQLYDMTRARFATFRYLLETRPWSFAMMVEIALDRLHHAFWHHMDETHPLYVPDSPFRNTIADYYTLLDHEIASTLDILPTHCGVMVVSDHGAQPMKGGFRINHWLQQQKYLALNYAPDTEAPLQPDMVNWEKTVAWGEGGYFGRIFLNVAGREPKGIVPPDTCHTLRHQLASQLESLCAPDGHPMGNSVLFPDQHFSRANGIPPDLIVYFGNLAWRSLGGVGPNPDAVGNGIYTRRNDRGPDGANHTFHGVCIGNFKPGTEAANGTFDVPGRLDIAGVASEILQFYTIQLPNNGMIKV